MDGLNEKNAYHHHEGDEGRCAGCGQGVAGTYVGEVRPAVHRGLEPWYRIHLTNECRTKVAERFWPWLLTAPVPAAPLPLSNIPEYAREFSVQPEERIMSKTEVYRKLLDEVADKGVVVLIPYRHGNTIQCKVLIHRDRP